MGWLKKEKLHPNWISWKVLNVQDYFGQPIQRPNFFNMVVFYYHNIDTKNRRCILAYMSKSVLDRFAVDRLNNSLGLQIASFIIKGV